MIYKSNKLAQKSIMNVMSWFIGDENLERWIKMQIWLSFTAQWFECVNIAHRKGRYTGAMHNLQKEILCLAKEGFPLSWWKPHNLEKYED